MQYFEKKVQYYNEYGIKRVHFGCNGNEHFMNGNASVMHWSVINGNYGNITVP